MYKLKATSGGSFSDWLPEPGAQAAEIVGVIELGKQPDNFGGDDKFQLLLCFELLDQLNPDNGDHPVLTEKVTASLNEKSKLTSILASGFGIKLAEGSEFDPAELLGKRCLVTIAHGQSKSNPDRSFAKIDGYSPIPKLMAKTVQALQRQHEPFTYEIASPEPFQRPSWLSEYLFDAKIADVIADGKRRLAGPNTPSPAPSRPRSNSLHPADRSIDDDIPF